MALRGLALLVVALVAAGCDTGDGTSLERPPETLPAAVTSTTVAATFDPAGGFQLLSPAVAELDFLPERYSRDGAAGSPPLSWSGVPDGTVELAVTVTDITVNGFVHWVIAGLDPTSVGLAEGQVPAGAVQAVNDAGELGWTGPFPPGDGIHTYAFRLHALGTPSGIADGADAATALAAVSDASVAIAEFAVLYE